MRKFIKSFLAFYRGYAWTEASAYDKHDKEYLLAFFKTHTGAKLLNNLKASGFEQDRLATLDKDPRWMAGVATGFRMAIAQIEVDTFSELPSAKVEEYEALPGRSGEERFEQNTR